MQELQGPSFQGCRFQELNLLPCCNASGDFSGGCHGWVPLLSCAHTVASRFGSSWCVSGKNAPSHLAHMIVYSNRPDRCPAPQRVDGAGEALACGAYPRVQSLPARELLDILSAGLTPGGFRGDSRRLLELIREPSRQAIRQASRQAARQADGLVGGQADRVLGDSTTCG